MKRPLRVGFVSARSLNQSDGMWADAGVGRVIDALAARFSEVHVAMSVLSDRQTQYDHRLSIPPERLVALPPLLGVVQGLGQSLSARRGIAEIERRCDVVLVQLPFAATPALIPPRKPRVYHVCANIVELVGGSPKFQGAIRWPARALSMAIDFAQARLIASPRARLVANGQSLLDWFGGPKKGVALVSSTLLDSEVESVKRQRESDVFRVLFVGYLRREKGIDLLVEACERVAKGTSRKMELWVVGPAELNDDGASQEIRESLERLKQVMSVSFLGHKKFGPELFQTFADADVLVLPSRSEGTPRVLVEARAFGCPVIATRVGGIPTSVQDGVDGLLVPPEDAEALTEALSRMMVDDYLRSKLKAAGIQTARRHTVEAMVDQMSGELERAAGL